jgi:maltooligosyltrehalose trehalohydrolase
VSEATFTSARLDWDERSKPEHAEMLEWYRSLLALRRAEPALTDPRADRVHVAYDDDERWLVLERDGFEVIVNLGETPRAVPVRDTPGRSVLLASGGPVTVTSATVIVPAGAVAITRRLTAGPDG